MSPKYLNIFILMFDVLTFYHITFGILQISTKPIFVLLIVKKKRPMRTQDPCQLKLSKTPSYNLSWHMHMCMHHGNC